MFEWLAKFDKILVTGPQRSGTRICAEMISYDIGYEYIDENDLDMDSLYCLCSLLENRRAFVVQCPALCRYIHLFNAEDTAVILMRRGIKEIAASQERIGWRWEWLELARYDRLDGTIAEVKYQFWEEKQRKQIANVFEVQYESLARHPLWLPRSLRDDFRPTQTAKQNENATIDPNARPRPRSDVFYSEQSDSGAAILVRRGPARMLNGTGRLVWTLCDGTRTRQDILRELNSHFPDVQEVSLAHDLDEFLNDMITSGFLWLSQRMTDR